MLQIEKYKFKKSQEKKIEKVATKLKKMESQNIQIMKHTIEDNK